MKRPVVRKFSELQQGDVVAQRASHQFGIASRHVVEKESDDNRDGRPGDIRLDLIGGGSIVGTQDEYIPVLHRPLPEGMSQQHLLIQVWFRIGKCVNHEERLSTAEELTGDLEDLRDAIEDLFLHTPPDK